MSKKITISSHKGDYFVNFIQGSLDQLNHNLYKDCVFIIDQNISIIYKSQLSNILNSERVLIIEASEQNKSLEKFPKYINALVDLNIRRGQTLIAIGGGIIQDITCFLASTVMRGLPWIFYPTTLLAQSDSCIGSKSSVNSGDLKNIIGTFTPPFEVNIDTNFLDTLEEKDIYSGVGEMIKVHAINSPKSFDLIAEKYNQLFNEQSIMEDFIYKSLIMKKKLIEIDEFDLGLRNVMNYGHSFGHAIESSTNYSIPHGIAVTIGMDIANYVAYKLGISIEAHFERMHKILDKNCKLYRRVKIDVDAMINALSKDKKNSASQLRLILPDKEGIIGIGLYDNDNFLFDTISNYFLKYGDK